MKGRGKDKKAEINIQPEFSTLNKDGKPVWEPGLPAEVTSRRVHKPVRKEPPEEAQVVCDLRNTLRLPPNARAEWLDKALRAIPAGRAKVQDVFNIVTHPKFVTGVPDRVGKRMLQMVARSLDAFSEKQRNTLVAKCKLAELFQASMHGAGFDDDDETGSEEEDGAADGERAALLLDEAEKLAARPRSPRRSRSRSRRRSGGTDVRTSSNRDPTPPAASDGRARGPKPPAEVSKDEPPRPASPSRIEPTPEERAKQEQAFLEKQRQQEEDRRKLEVERKRFEERERQRKAKLSSAFLVGNEEEEDDEAARSLLTPGTMTMVRKPQPEKTGPQDLPYADQPPPTPGAGTGAVAVARGAPAQASWGGGQDPRFVEAMGGDKILAEAHKILQSAAGSGRLGAPARSRSRGRKRSRSRSRSRSTRRRNIDMRSTGSYRSPTPDGRARGQARAARKAKMIASLMGLNKARQ